MKKKHFAQKVLNPKDLNLQHEKLESHVVKQSYPIPRGETAYCEAKRAEYQEKNFEKALYFYDLAIKENDRKGSAIKDMAGLLHSQGKTQEAIELMEKYESEFVEEREKFLNLLGNLKKLMIPKGNAANKWIKISNIPKKLNTDSFVRSQFNEGQKRIIVVQSFLGENYAVVKFNSHSGAKKSLESFSERSDLTVSLLIFSWNE